MRQVTASEKSSAKQPERDKLYLTGVTLFCVCFSVLATWQAVGSTGPAVNSPEQAAILASSYVWSGKHSQPATVAADDAAVVTMQDTTTPFLADSIAGRKAWKVTFRSVVLNIDSCPQALLDAYPRDIEVWIDSADGRLLRISSWIAESPHNLPSVPNAREAAGQMDRERYEVHPSTTPEISWMNAVGKAFGNMVQAEYIEAHYVLYTSRQYSRPVSAWAVYLHEFPAVTGGYTSMRSVIDATTGVDLYFTNTPRLMGKSSELKNGDTLEHRK